MLQGFRAASQSWLGKIVVTVVFGLLIAGLATGAIYALAAIGFTLLWQTSQTINFAQGEFVMVPAFFALIAMKWFGLPVPLALVMAVLMSMLLLGVAFVGNMLSTIGVLMLAESARTWLRRRRNPEAPRGKLHTHYLVHRLPLIAYRLQTLVKW